VKLWTRIFEQYIMCPTKAILESRVLRGWRDTSKPHQQPHGGNHVRNGLSIHINISVGAITNLMRLICVNKDINIII
jgi:hypothetical protein